MIAQPLLDLPSAGPAYPARLRTMLRAFGATPGRVCRECRHCLVNETHGGRYRKCDLTIQTHGPGTDWRAGWPACGRFCGKEGEP